jgi:hypothetical protein
VLGASIKVVSLGSKEPPITWKLVFDFPLVYTTQALLSGAIQNKVFYQKMMQDSF